jgi:hypothetical protein
MPYIIHESSSFNTYVNLPKKKKSIITVLFLLVFWFLLLLESYIHLDYAAKMVLFGVGFSSTRTARERDERCEHVRIFVLPLTNFFKYYHVKSK